MFRIRYFITAFLVSGFLIPAGTSFALDGKKNPDAATVSMHEVARQIRQYKSWQILDASPRKLDSGDRILRFKLLHEKGKVIIINIDPKNPNFRRLE